MISSLEIQNFRAFSKLRVSDLRRINIVTGGNASLIIVVDNDDDPKQALLSAQRAIITSPVFAGPPKRKMRSPRKAMVSTKGPPKVAIVPIPAVGQPGALETLCIQAAQTVVPATVIGCADQFIRCNGIDQWTTSKRAKVKMRAIIAASHKPNPEMTLTKLWDQKPALVPVTDPIFADMRFYGRSDGRRFARNIFPNSRSNASSLSSQPSLRAVSTNRSYCRLSLVFGVRFCFSPAFPIRPLSD